MYNPLQEWMVLEHQERLLEQAMGNRFPKPVGLPFSWRCRFWAARIGRVFVSIGLRLQQGCPAVVCPDPEAHCSGV